MKSGITGWMREDKEKGYVDNVGVRGWNRFEAKLFDIGNKTTELGLQ